jgi:hypothetical protein
MTHTLSDYPLLIGEILRRDHLRAQQQAKLRAIFSDLQRALGMRVAQGRRYSQETVGRLGLAETGRGVRGRAARS